MLSQQVDLMPAAYLNCKDYLTTGQFACIGAPTEERYDLVSDIPTLKEQGIDLVFPDCDYSFYFPKDTPDEVIAWYDKLVADMETNQDCLDAISAINVVPYYLDSAASEANDEAYYNTFVEIANSVEQ